MKIIKLPIYNIVVTLNDHGTGIIKSDLVGSIEEDIITSVILAHACAGVNIEDPKYIEGIKTLLDAIVNNVE